jgi:hypothetical protein
MVFEERFESFGLCEISELFDVEADGQEVVSNSDTLCLNTLQVNTSLSYQIGYAP